MKKRGGEGKTCAEKRGKRDYRSDKSQYLDEGWRGIPRGNKREK